MSPHFFRYMVSAVYIIFTWGNWYEEEIRLCGGIGSCREATVKIYETEELVIMMKAKLSSMFQQAVADTTLAVMTNGEFSVSLFNFIVKLQVNGYYLFFL